MFVKVKHEPFLRSAYLRPWQRRATVLSAWFLTHLPFPKVVMVFWTLGQSNHLDPFLVPKTHMNTSKMTVKSTELFDSSILCKQSTMITVLWSHNFLRNSKSSRILCKQSTMITWHSGILQQQMLMARFCLYKRINKVWNFIWTVLWQMTL